MLLIQVLWLLAIDQKKMTKGNATTGIEVLSEMREQLKSDSVIGGYACTTSDVRTSQERDVMNVDNPCMASLAFTC